MSSIYKKGRDGYFYYQAYVYNPKTKKKDKRAFHALSTKDISEAKIKQKELDAYYEKYNNKINNQFKGLINLRSKSTFLFILTFIFFGTLLSRKIVSALKSESSNELTLIDDFQIAKSSQSITTDSTTNTKKDTTFQKERDFSETVIPNYSIERVDRVSGAFEQGELHVIIDKNSSKESQQLLCHKLTERYEEFSNIIICLYANNQIGKNLANGQKNYITNEEKKQTWLAMYTYNPVEGAYFDNSPSDYLNAY